MDDRISELPAPILHHILSFLSQKKAVRTCVLSKSWRHLASTRPNFRLRQGYFEEGDKENFKKVLEKSLQVYYEQKLSIDDFRVWPPMVDPELVRLLEKWIPILVHDMGVKIFRLFFNSYFDLPAVVFESESLQELYLHRCCLSKINSISFGNHLKTLFLLTVHIKEEESFAKLMSSCPLIQDLSLLDCKGFKTIKLHNHHNLKSFELSNIDDYGSNIEIYLPSTIGDMWIKRCPNWLHHRNYFPGVTCLRLDSVPLSKEWFNSLSRNFPCLEDLKLIHCYGVDEIQVSSRSIKKLKIKMVKSTNKATIDTPSIKEFKYAAYISQSISFSATTSSSCAWNSRVSLYSLDLDDSQLLLKISGLVAAFSQSRISLALHHNSDRGNNIEQYLSADISVCCSSYQTPVAIESLELYLKGHYYDSFFSDLVNGLFRIFRPREIKQAWYVKFDVVERADRQRNRNKAVEFLCRSLQLEDDEGTRSFFWQHDLEEASLDVLDRDVGEWRPVQLGGR